jgi:hypothetical protein
MTQVVIKACFSSSLFPFTFSSRCQIFFSSLNPVGGGRIDLKWSECVQLLWKCIETQLQSRTYTGIECRPCWNLSKDSVACTRLERQQVFSAAQFLQRDYMNVLVNTKAQCCRAASFLCNSYSNIYNVKVFFNEQKLQQKNINTVFTSLHYTISIVVNLTCNCVIVLKSFPTEHPGLARATGVETASRFGSGSNKMIRLQL